MELDSEDRLLEVPEAGDSLIVEMDVRDLTASLQKALTINTEAMILACDLHTISQEV